MSALPINEGAVRLRLLFFSALITLLATALLVGLALDAEGIAETIEGGGAAQVPLMLAAIALLTPALVSAGLLAAAAGYALGIPTGFPLALGGLTLGAVLAAALVRLVSTHGAARALGSRAAAFASWVEARPLRSVIFARLVPGLPFGITSYACGLTTIALPGFALATAVGFAPRCFVYTALGGSIRDIGSPEAKAALASTLAIALFSLVLPRLFPALRPAPKTKNTTEQRYRWMT
ncbi:MAG TPA: VTT domain-containing protein [Solirubrobacterales bacterium]|nr:VTT domain-containing protein [Solirubrobacterales bacterium]